MINPPLAKKQTPGQVLNVSGLSPFLPFLGLDRPFNPLQSATVSQSIFRTSSSARGIFISRRQIPLLCANKKTHKLLCTNSFRTAPRNLANCRFIPRNLQGHFLRSKSLNRLEHCPRSSKSTSQFDCPEFRSIPRNLGEMFIHSAQLGGTFAPIKIVKSTGKVSRIIQIRPIVRNRLIPHYSAQLGGPIPLVKR